MSPPVVLLSMALGPFCFPKEGAWTLKRGFARCDDVMGANSDFPQRWELCLASASRSVVTAAPRPLRQGQAVPAQCHRVGRTLRRGWHPTPVPLPARPVLSSTPHFPFRGSRDSSRRNGQVSHWSSWFSAPVPSAGRGPGPQTSSICSVLSPGTSFGLPGNHGPAVF